MPALTSSSTSPAEPHEDIPPGRWLDIPTAAGQYFLSTKTLYRRIKDGTLRAYTVAGTRALRVNTADLDAMFTVYGGAE